MKRKWYIVLSMLIYILFLIWTWGFDITKLLDWKLFLQLLIGAFLLTLPFYRKAVGWRVQVRELLPIFGKKALEAGYIQTFLLLFMGVSDGELRADIVMNFRPVLYGFCLFVLLMQNEEEEPKTEKKQQSREEQRTKIEPKDRETQKNEIEQQDREAQETGIKPQDREAQKTGIKPQDRETKKSGIEQQDREAQRTGIAFQDREVQRSGIEQQVREEQETEKKLEKAPFSVYERFRQKGLTKRESEIALLICNGCSNREIAEEFVISETTVKKHVSNIFEKTGIEKREELKKLL